MYSQDELQNVRWVTYIFALLGLLVITNFLYNVALIIIEHFNFLKRDFVKKYGKWAVITGCTNGIGKSYAEELAKSGMSTVLISRNIDKLNHLAIELEKTYGIETEILQVDFTEGRAVYKGVESCLEGKEIGILVNNVGITAGSPKWFDKQSKDEIWNSINVNVASVPAMVNVVLPSMLKRRKGCIINVASLASVSSLSVASLYTGTKAFVDAFSQSLCSDLAHKGIEVQTLLPSFVATDMLSYSKIVGKPSLMSPSSSLYTKKAVRTIGVFKRTTGYWVHNIMKLFMENSLTKPMVVYISNVIWKRLMLEKERSASI